jgi:hypothetical protein|tara:strand:- start:458 stop:1198 length:741 start_codon:yes stop_codon:yes gene_type:complete
MIDYKLILILILSIVLLYIYNRTESLKNDINRLDKNIKADILNLENKISNNNNFCKMPTYDKIFTNEIKKEEINENEESKEINNFDINTLDFTATENNTESEDINFTSSDNIIIYSNDENKNIINVENIIEKLASETLNLENTIPNLVEVINNFNNINSELDYEESDKNLDIIDTTNSINEDDNKNLNNSEKISLNLDLKSKLIEIQDYAKSLNIEVNKNINDKIRNKTKKELLDEINKLNLINHK